MSEITYNNVTPYGWGRSFDLTAKGHLVAKRVWRKKADLEAYLNNVNLSAASGIIVVVLEDTPENNGAWLVERVPGDPAFPGYKDSVAKLTKLATGDTQLITLSKQSEAAGVTLTDNVLDIPDMRTYWDDQSFN